MRHFISKLIITSFSLLLAGCTNLFFQPDHICYSHLHHWDANGRTIQITAKDGTKLTSWFLPAPHSKATVFFLHGNAQNVSSHVHSVAWLIHHDYNVFLFEYRGFGANQGTPDLEKTIQDIVSAFDNIQRINHKPIALFGQSLGGSIALYIAGNKHIKPDLCAVIAEAPFADYRSIVREKLANHWLTWGIQYPLLLTINNTYSPEKQVANISPVPLLIIHSKDDNIVPIHHGRTLFEKAKEPKEFWETHGHHIAFLKSQNEKNQFLTYLNSVCAK